MTDPHSITLALGMAFINGSALGAALVMAIRLRVAEKNQPLSPRQFQIGLSEKSADQFRARLRASEEK